jgi:hypothetical protein
MRGYLEELYLPKLLLKHKLIELKSVHGKFKVKFNNDTSV